MLATHDVDPSPRLAAVLAIAEPARCIALLARLQRADNMWNFIPALSAAQLAYLDRGLEVPAELERMWTELAGRDPPIGYEKDVAEARLKLTARRDPIVAISMLRDAVAQNGATGLGSGIAAVVARAVAVDRKAAWALTRELRWAHARALALEGIARIEPHADEVEPTLRRLLDEWRTRGPNVVHSPSGELELATPLLATCAHARGMEAGCAVIELLGASPMVISMSTSIETRRANLADGRWTPDVWDSWIAAPNQGQGSGHAAMQSDLHIPALAAWWKLDTLPLRELPWYRPEDDRLP